MENDPTFWFEQPHATCGFTTADVYPSHKNSIKTEINKPACWLLRPFLAPRPGLPRCSGDKRHFARCRACSHSAQLLPWTGDHGRSERLVDESDGGVFGGCNKHQSRVRADSNLYQRMSTEHLLVKYCVGLCWRHRSSRLFRRSLNSRLPLVAVHIR